MTCSYWLMGGCRDPKEGPTPEDEEPNENSCCFLHDFLPMPAPPTPPLSALVSGAFAAAGMGAMSLPPAAAPPAASPTISPDDEEQFPALTPSKPSASSSNDKASAATTPVAAAAAAAATATATTVAKSFLQVALSTDKVKKPSPAAAAGGGGAATATAAGAASSSGGAKTVNLKDLVSRQKLASVWVIGGEEVRRQYQQARDEASRAAQARNRCFMQATAAFQRGEQSQMRGACDDGVGVPAVY